MWQRRLYREAPFRVCEDSGNKKGMGGVHRIVISFLSSSAIGTDHRGSIRWLPTAAKTRQGKNGNNRTQIVQELQRAH
jgi:hypothetical protein